MIGAGVSVLSSAFRLEERVEVVSVVDPKVDDVVPNKEAAAEGPKEGAVPPKGKLALAAGGVDPKGDRVEGVIDDDVAADVDDVVASDVNRAGVLTAGASSIFDPNCGNFGGSVTASLVSLVSFTSFFSVSLV